MEQILNQKAKFYAKHLWDLDFQLPVKINKRLASTLGRYGQTEIDLAARILVDEYFTDDILLHELCHWYCHIIGEKYDDHTYFFEQELERIGASSSYTMDIRNGQSVYLYPYGCFVCKHCPREVETKDYLEDRVEGVIGRSIKTFDCCNNKMVFKGLKYVLEEYMPTSKIVALNSLFKNELHHN